MIEHECFGSERDIVKNLATKNYKSASLAAFRNPTMKEFLVKKFYDEARTELKHYSKKKSSVFRFNGSFEKLAEYKGVELINECQVELPLTYGFVSHTSGQKSPKTLFNKKVLALSSLLNSWIPMSTFIYRDNVILTAGGCKKTEIKTFHDLGKSLYVLNLFY